MLSAQLEELQLKTDIQRMDSFQPIVNIRTFGRAQLLVEVLIYLYKMLSANDKEIIKELLAE